MAKFTPGDRHLVRIIENEMSISGIYKLTSMIWLMQRKRLLRWSQLFRYLQYSIPIIEHSAIFSANIIQYAEMTKCPSILNILHLSQNFHSPSKRSWFLATTAFAKKICFKRYNISTTLYWINCIPKINKKTTYCFILIILRKNGG